MSNPLSLGAINKITGEYVYPKIANKKDEYTCRDCNKDVILCHGEIRAPYFRHKVDSINPCHHYSNPTEGQIHYESQMLLKNLLERKRQILINRICCSCGKNEEFEPIPEMTDGSVIQLEYRFKYKNELKIADVAYLDGNDILCFFEMLHTHKTRSENRPEPWFEFDAETLIKLANDINSTSLQIPCVRCEKCEDCSEREKNELILKVKHNNAAKLNNLQPEYEKELKCYNNSDDDWGRGYNTSRLDKIRKRISNIKSEIEIDFIKNNIKYHNENDEYFILDKNRQTIKISDSGIIINNLNIEKHIEIDKINNWYHDINLSENIIDKCFEYVDCLDNLDICIRNKNAELIDPLLIKINNYISEIYKLDSEKTDWKFKTSIGVNKLFECDLIKNRIEYSSQDASGTPIYTIKRPNTNEYIKYSFSSKKIYMDKKWHQNLDLDSLLYGKVYLNIPFSDKDKCKSYGGIWDTEKKMWYISKNNKNIEIILNTWKERKF